VYSTVQGCFADTPRSGVNPHSSILFFVVTGCYY
jgi:hypothetical protein